MYWLTGILSAAMAVAPFLLGYRDHSLALWMSVVLGIVVLVASVLEAMDVKHARWEWWVAGVAGVVAVLAPFVFGFTALTMAVWAFVVLGLVLIIAASYELFYVPQPA